MYFLIYTDGNMVLEILERYKGELVWLIKEFTGIGTLDFHAYMDYISYENDCRKAHEAIKNEANLRRSGKRNL